MTWLLVLSVVTTSTWASGDPAYHEMKILVDNEQKCEEMLHRALNQKGGSALVLYGKCEPK